MFGQALAGNRKELLSIAGITQNKRDRRVIFLLFSFALWAKHVLNYHPSRILILGDGMGYHISYQSIQKKHVKKRHYMRLPLLIMLCFLLFLFLVETKWSDGAALIRKVCSLPDSVVAVAALNDFANELRQGETLAAAFSEFWRKLIS